MKKTIKLLTLLLLVVLNSCIDKDAWLNKMNNARPKDGDSYLAININASNGDGTRAADGTSENGGNATLEDGNANEDKIKNAYLLVFRLLNSETDIDKAVLCGTFNIFNFGEGSCTENVHISNHYSIRNLVLYDFKPVPDTRYYGLVLANINGNDLQITLSSLTYRDSDGSHVHNTDGSLQFGTFKSNARFLLGGSSGSAQPHHLIDKDGFLVMGNAMLFDVTDKAAADMVQGGSGPKPIELIEITSKIKEVPYDSDPADSEWATFHIERVAAKVQVTVEDGKLTGKFREIDYSPEMDYEIKQWCIVNVAPDTYLFRHWYFDWPAFVNAASKRYRFISSGDHPVFTDGNKSYHRGYFTISTQYETNDWSTGTGNFHYQGWKEFGSIDYCHENTMQAYRMMVKNATHVLVEVQFNNGNTFTGVNGKTYTNGKSYYLLKIPHFGNEFTPWRSGESDNVQSLKPYDEMTEAEKADRNNTVNIDRCYPNDAVVLDDAMGRSIGGRYGNYYGRWGVVRNTWYKLNITGIVALGMNESPLDYPTIITDDPTPLDYYEDHWMQFKAEVVDWHLREQSATLQ